jgi:hypothetical protein
MTICIGYQTTVPVLRHGIRRRLPTGVLLGVLAGVVVAVGGVSLLVTLGPEGETRGESRGENRDGSRPCTEKSLALETESAGPTPKRTGASFFSAFRAAMRLFLDYGD